MNSSSMMAGVLVVGALPTMEMPVQHQYLSAPLPVRKDKKTIPVRISVKKSDK